MTDNIEKIFLRKPYIEETARSVRLCSDITLSEDTKTIWFEVSKEYAPYLVDDRLDAFVVLFLFSAMKAGADIVCEAPVSKKLLYQLNEQLLPVLANNIEEFSPVHVDAKPADLHIPCENAVGTGWTGGVDCMYTFSNSFPAKEPGMSLTHLVIANIGTLESDNNEEVLKKLLHKAENNIVKDTGLKVVGINSNLDSALPEHYLSVAGYRLPAAILTLQKLFRTFYNSSAYEFSRFAFVPYNSAYYEMIILPNLSTENTVFYSSGAATSRIEKLKELSDNPYARKYLHPCIYSARQTNCGTCGKCIRTLAALYALGTLDRFGEVFDLDQFEKNKDDVLADVIEHKLSQHYGEAYVLLKGNGQITKRAEQIANAKIAAKKIALKNQERLSKLLKFTD